MFKEFFLRRRAFKVGQNIRHTHEGADTTPLSGQRLVNLAIDHWKDYCEAVSPARDHVWGPSAKERKLLANDYLRAIYLKGFTEGYLSEDTPRYWAEESVKE